MKKTFDLEKRMIAFAKDIQSFTNQLAYSQANKIYINQILRSASSIGANYIEANDSLGKKDFLMKIRISRREARETRYWLQLVDISTKETLDIMRKGLLDEVEQLIRILMAIMRKIEIKKDSSILKQ